MLFLHRKDWKEFEEKLKLVLYILQKISVLVFNKKINYSDSLSAVSQFLNK